MTRRQKANILLLISLILCLSVAPWKDSDVLIGFFFHVFFAMTIGAAADWFAVTSLFKRPLGVSWHTDIIAENRDKIVIMARDMVQNEFFTVQWLKEILIHYPLSERLRSYLISDKIVVCAVMNEVLGLFLSIIDKSKIYQFLLSAVHKEIGQISWSLYIAQAMDIFLKSPDKEKIVTLLSKAAERFLTHQVTQEEIGDLYEAVWQEYKKKGWLRGLLSGTVEDAKDKSIKIVQMEIVKLATSLRDPESEIGKTLAHQYVKIMEKLRNDEKYRKQVDDMISGKLQWLIQNDGETVLTMLYEKKKETIKAYIVNTLWKEALAYVENEKTSQYINQWVWEESPKYIPYIQKAAGQVTVEVLRAYDGEKMAQGAEKSIDHEVQLIRINGTLCGGILGGLFYIAKTVGGYFL